MCQLAWDLNSDRYDRSQTTDLNNSQTRYHPATALTAFVVYNSVCRPILSLPLLKQLHWLPVNYRIKFKLCTLTFRALAIHQPPYLASLLHFSNIPRQLRSSTSQQLSIPRTKLNLGKRAFSVAAQLPTTLKSCESLASFRKNLKTYLFKIAFPP